MRRMQNTQEIDKCERCNEGVLSTNSLCNCSLGVKKFKAAIAKTGIPDNHRTAKLSMLSGKVSEVFNSLKIDDTFYIYGSVGVGKSFAAAAFIKQMVFKNYWRPYIKFQDVIQYKLNEYYILDFREFLISKDREKRIEKAKFADYLIIDDLFAHINNYSQNDFRGSKMDEIIMLLELILDARAKKRLKTSFISNLKFETLRNDFSEVRLTDRIKGHFHHYFEIREKSRRGEK